MHEHDCALLVLSITTFAFPKSDKLISCYVKMMKGSSKKFLPYKGRYNKFKI